ncbi:MAG: rRNA maturation RNase YbeY [Lachnospiraceae bacterium]|nr:rRNA maturation RNase YbeY [Lachnospiraceae bacterium]
MTFYVENETDGGFPFSLEEAAKKVILGVLEWEACPYEVQVNVLLTDKEGIKEYNSRYRNIEKETDVLSFPNVDYEAPGDFSMVEKNEMAYADPDTGEIYLGDIILCRERIVSQAVEYGHSELREFSFLIAHSMLHLLGYDHMEEAEEKIMIEKQEKILDKLGITRN